MKLLNAALLFLAVWAVIRIYRFFQKSQAVNEKKRPTVRVKQDPNAKHQDPDLSDVEYIDFEEVKE